MSSQWLASKALKFKFNYGFINSNFSRLQSQNTAAPKHIASINADWAIWKNIDANATWRYVDDAQILDGSVGSKKTLDSFHGVDLALHWHISPDMTLSAYGKNLFYGSHVEYESDLFHLPHRVEPSYYGKISIQF